MKKKILGVSVDDLDEREVFEKIEELLNDGRQHYLVLPYSEFIVMASRDRGFRDVINRADLCLCDGRGLFLAARFLGRPLKAQIPGVELAGKICRGFPGIFLFGGRPEVVRRLADKFGRENIAGFIDGYQKDSRVIEEINRAKPQILLVALGAPKQEKWIADNLAKMPSVKLALGVGGAFDFLSGRIRRAPKLLRKAGLEWLWRFLRQPRRIGRVCRATVVFPWLAMKEKLSTRK